METAYQICGSDGSFHGSSGSFHEEYSTEVSMKKIVEAPMEAPINFHEKSK